MPTGVVVADDEALVRMGLRMLLDGEDDLVVVAEATDGRPRWRRPAGRGRRSS